jgi:hypothetical protein
MELRLVVVSGSGVVCFGAGGAGFGFGGVLTGAVLSGIGSAALSGTGGGAGSLLYKPVNHLPEQFR